MNTLGEWTIDYITRDDETEGWKVRYRSDDVAVIAYREDSSDIWKVRNVVLGGCVIWHAYEENSSDTWKVREFTLGGRENFSAEITQDGQDALNAALVGELGEVKVGTP